MICCVSFAMPEAGPENLIFYFWPWSGYLLLIPGVLTQHDKILKKSLLFDSFLEETELSDLHMADHRFHVLMC